VLVSDFDFDLTEDLIAQEAVPRGQSRLLVLHRGSGAVEHSAIAELPTLLSRGDVLVVNDTRVFAARLLGHRMPSGGVVECLLLSKIPGPPAARPPDPEPARPPRSEIWSALMHPGQKMKPGARVRFDGAAGVLIAEVVERHFHGRRTIRLWAEPGRDVDALVDALGHMPLPPYIKRGDTALDRERYQTIFARNRGSVAAPTAGLHFTPALMTELAERGVQRADVTLHVGYGTFKPVRTDIVEAHAVDSEDYEIGQESADAINRALDEGRRIVAVGTTTTRALEHAAVGGSGRIAAGRGTASLFIYPGFSFQIVGALLTNFHLPRSSLLMLVCAFAGRERVLATYREAIARRYRFYSSGDAMLIA